MVIVLLIWGLFLLFKVKVKLFLFKFRLNILVKLVKFIILLDVGNLN